MVFDQLLSFRHNVLGEARLTSQFNFRLQPKLGLAIRVRNMNMYPCLLPGEEKEPEWPVQKNQSVSSKTEISSHCDIRFYTGSCEIASPQASEPWVGGSGPAGCISAALSP